MKNIILFIIIILIFLQLINITFILENSNEILNKKQEKPQKINIVVARYNEYLKWTLEEPFNQFKYIVYNKGDNENFEKKNVLEIIKLENIGRDFHTHLYHIVNNYNNLADINIFLPGSLELYYKKIIAKHLINNVIKYNQSVLCVPFLPYANNFLYNYKHEDYINSSKFNQTDKCNKKVVNADIRPFGKWYNNNFKESLNYVTQFGIFSINKNDILQHPKEKYDIFLSKLSKSINPEEGYFIEISIFSIFYPYNNTIIENCYKYWLFSLPILLYKILENNNIIK